MTERPDAGGAAEASQTAALPAEALLQRVRDWYTLTFIAYGEKYHPHERGLDMRSARDWRDDLMRDLKAALKEAP